MSSPDNLHVNRSAPQASVTVPVTPGTALLPNGVCKFVWIGTAGTLNFVDAAGNSVTGFPVLAGRNDIMCSKILSGGSASNIWAMY